MIKQISEKILFLYACIIYPVFGKLVDIFVKTNERLYMFSVNFTKNGNFCSFLLARPDTLRVYFDIKFIREDQKERKYGEACRASRTCFWSS